MKSVAVLGSTGAIGTRTLDVIRELGEEYIVPVLVAGRNVERLAEQVKAFRPKLVVVADDEARRALLSRLDSHDVSDVLIGDEGLVAAAQYPSDVVVNAVMGARGILPALETVKRGARLALANKECLVAAGHFIMDTAKQNGSEILPVDSEHSALFQCLSAGRTDEVERLILTASGGPFRTFTKEELRDVTLEQALRHPNWSMGKKITVDSATLMNKGLEVIEAHHLFQAPYDKISVLVHPESIVHSMVEYKDGSVMAQLATHDMRLPIQHALTYPSRVALSWPRLDFKAYRTLSFEEPDLERFPALRLAMEAGRTGQFAPCILNAANEVAVEHFLEQRISYRRITEVVEETLQSLEGGKPSTVADILAMDQEARRCANAILQKG